MFSLRQLTVEKTGFNCFTQNTEQITL